MSACKSLSRICTKPTRPSILPITQTRHESTTRRHKKLLHLPEAPSYTPDRSAPTLIFNPPSSAPSVYNTPLKFLPRSDERKGLYAAALSYSTRTSLQRSQPTAAAAGTPLSTSSFLPPKPSSALPQPVRAPYEKKYHLTEREIEEIRTLRAQDPKTWTRVKLAERFGCSQFFVGMVAKNAEAAERAEREHEKSRERWGARRRMAKEDRARRRLLWGQDA